MKSIYFLLISLPVISCGKSSNDESRCKADLLITKTNTPATATIAAGISSNIDAYGANLCYSYSHNEIVPTSGNIYQIRIKGNVPCNATVCAQALYTVQTQLTIHPAQAGTYYLHFFNYDAFFKRDTVIVQ